ncbi:ricin-type beta-trefoil lectin domain protein [Dactylosporangium sp. NBC_01737]|uniref:ricin-type beta-trefoil lectin domain protein n=1 Tax=Dactylosporangium sp. NBC_01737 TaxID=2975959 RepID=UPI002E145BE1|nr:ricin-type beta-trefoil lectin domain protein [Dactylosporangium sp. NBC_01737]
MFRRTAAAILAAVTIGAVGWIAVPDALAAGETVNVWLTTTSDAGGRTVTRGLAQQPAVGFTAGTGGGGQNITVNDATRYQTFTGGGASFTDTAAWLMNSSGALSAGTRATVMQKLFDPVNGIGVSFLRNPMGASDLARFGYTYDDRPAGQTDPSLANFSIAHDLADVLPLTKQAQQLNPQLSTMASPWTAPAWMKDNGNLNGGWLQAQYYGAYAQYFVKYIQAYQAQGVKVNFVTPQNEPTCCAGYPSMSWNASGLDYFTASNLLPALQGAGLSTKVLAHDWNWDTYDAYAAQSVNNAAVRNHPNFGGIAWHGYGGDVGKQSTVHNQYPGLDAYDTEHSGGTWIGNQQQEDMLNLINYGRNWGKSFIKWSLAVDQNMGPHYGGCGTCTGLITVHNGDSRSGQVDYTVEYYTMGHLTKFVKPGAYRVDSTANGSVPNIAYLNPDGTRALIAYNNTSSSQQVTVNWSGQRFTYTLPTKTSATFTWKAGATNPNPGRTGAVTGLAGKCVDVAGSNTANGTVVQLYTCNGSGAQQWTVGTDGTLRALGKCLDVNAASTADGTKIQLWDCNGSAAQAWTAGTDGTLRALGKCLDVTGNVSTDGTPLQLWTCFAGANQRWVLPA